MFGCYWYTHSFVIIICVAQFKALYKPLKLKLASDNCLEEKVNNISSERFGRRGQGIRSYKANKPCC